MALASAAIAGGLASAAYLDAKFHLRKDMKTIYRMKTAEKQWERTQREGRASPWYMLEDTCKKNWNSQAIWSRAGSYTFGQVHDQCAQYAQWLLDQGIRPGDLVALYLFNSAEFIIIWFACLSIGAAPAFINYNLEGKALLHCLAVCDSKLIIVDEDAGCQRRIEKSREQIEAGNTKIVVLDRKFKQDVTSKPAIVPDEKWRLGMKGDFPYCLIYTSGTTGLPKGCAFNIARVHLLGFHLFPFYDGVPGVDKWYNSMPLYHGTGAITSSSALISGLTVALTPKFSVSGFWPDVHDSQSTYFIYVGETARYLINAPPHPLERAHKLKGAYGNGLRPDVWARFQQRFNVPEIIEFFNSTEGMFALFVWDKGPYLQGCVGHHGVLLRSLLHNVFVPVRIDHETGDIWRNPKTGFAQRMPYKEGGEILVAVPDKKAFQGYWKAEAATEKKFSQDIFKKGDLFYRCGDALRRSPDGKWYFMDRLGDTFRWKSENVSTAEVAEALGKYPGISEANVYGVLVPNHEGRAGCAALHLDSNQKGEIDYGNLVRYVREKLPKYAVPVFLRIVQSSSHIHNHKQNKVGLRKEGVDPTLLGTEEPNGKNDVFMWLTPKADTYKVFDESDWKALQTSQAKL